MTRPVSFVARSLAYYRAKAYSVDVTERWLPRTSIRKDAFGFADLLVFSGDYTALVQVCHRTDAYRRIEKIEASAEAKAWASAPGRAVEVLDWDLAGKAGARKLWTPRRRRGKWGSGGWRWEDAE